MIIMVFDNDVILMYVVMLLNAARASISVKYAPPETDTRCMLMMSNNI